MKLQHIKFTAQIQAMANDEVLRMISPRTIRDIKREDPNPMFKAFCIGHEGTATPKIVDVGSTVQRWYQTAIEKLTNKMGLGLPAYHNHAATNKEKNRPPIGEIVGKVMKKINGFLSSIAVAYIFPQFKDLPLDIASIEADIQVPYGSREFDVDDIDVLDVTGIALGNSQTDKPAFAGATLLATLQAMAEKPNKGDNKMTLEEIKAGIQEGKFKPSDLFGAKELTLDPFIAEFVKDETSNLRGYQYRKLKEAEEKAEAAEKDKTALKAQVETFERAQGKMQAREAFDGILKERPKLAADPRLIKFVQKAFEKGFTPKDTAKVKDELNKFVDDQVTEFADLMGETKGAGDNDGKTDAQKAAEAAAAAAEENRDKTNLLDPKNNELIPAL